MHTPRLAFPIIKKIKNVAKVRRQGQGVGVGKCVWEGVGGRGGVVAGGKHSPNVDRQRSKTTQRRGEGVSYPLDHTNH